MKNKVQFYLSILAISALFVLPTMSCIKWKGGEAMVVL
jgi:hypothetical protein